MTTAYTWSKVLTTASGFNDNPEDPFNQKFNYGPATFDRAHVFALTYTYTLKMFSGSTGFVKAVFDGYEVSGITRLPVRSLPDSDGTRDRSSKRCSRKPAC